MQVSPKMEITSEWVLQYFASEKEQGFHCAKCIGVYSKKTLPMQNLTNSIFLVHEPSVILAGEEAAEL